MAETAGGVSRNPVTSAPDALLATKLYVPRPRAGYVPRPRLVERLDEGLAGELILLCAPAGFGKTALLADWCQRRKGSTGWLALDGDDNDPVRFWRHVTAALDGVHPGLAERVAPLLGPPPPRSFDGVVSRLVNELASGDPAGEQLLLVLDDYHLIDAEPVHESLRFLLEHAPPKLRVVLASRADPPLPLARLRARGQLAELRAADLRLTTDEAAAMLRDRLGADLPEGVVTALTARTEGWAAGLQLAGLSMQRQPDAAAFVATFSGSQRYVLDYLTEEVLAHQPAPVRQFLLDTSVLERLSGPLCDAVIDRTDGQAMLETIERANLFLTPLDEVRIWWRYHHLFADLLRARLQQEQPERRLELHRRAASWYEQHGLVNDAIRHALAAEDPAWAARLVEWHFEQLHLDSDGATVHRWIAALPPELIGNRPRLLVAQISVALRGGRVEQVEELVQVAERGLARAADDPYEPSAGRAASRLVNLPAAIALVRAFVAFFRGDAATVGGRTSQALAEIDEGESVLMAIADTLLAGADWLRGRLDEAQRAFASPIPPGLVADQSDLAALTCIYLGQVQRTQGRLDAALQTYQQALEVAAAPDRPLAEVAGVAHVGIAEVAYQRNQLDTAQQAIDRGIPLCRRFGYAQSVATGLATQAWIRHTAGDPADATDLMAEAARVADPAVTDLLNPVPAQQARLWLAQGQTAAAAQWIADRGLRPDDPPNYPQEPAYLVLARVLLARDRPDQALRLLDQLHAAAATQGRIGSVIEIQALRTQVLAANGAEDSAMAALAEALALAHPQGYFRVFVDEGPSMGALIGRLITIERTDRDVASDIPLSYLGRLTRAFEQDAAASRSGATGAPTIARHLVTQLSDREREILHLLAAGKQNQQIAGELYLALNTVKKHVTHVFQKLGATNRTEATNRARELGLLD